MDNFIFVIGDKDVNILVILAVLLCIMLLTKIIKSMWKITLISILLFGIYILFFA